MMKNALTRRSFCGATLALAAGAGHAQVSNLGDAINKAGRQRMLSQRMAKAWMGLGQGIKVESARRVLDQSMSLFDRQLTELKAFAPAGDLSVAHGAGGGVLEHALRPQAARAARQRVSRAAALHGGAVERGRLGE